MDGAKGGGTAAEQRLIADTVAAYARRPQLVALCCGIQRYAWGDRRFIPNLLGAPGPSDQPQAELWIGAHPDLPAAACLGALRVPLDQLIAAAPAHILGDAAVRRFGTALPFLFKVLAAATPLSIQAHPNRADAERGFAREHRLGRPLGNPKRSYRDRNHKPELLVALTDFHALRGFRPLDEIAHELARYPSLGDLARDFDGSQDALRRLYADFMRLPQPAVDDLLAPVVALSRRRAQDPNDPGQARCHWLLRAHGQFTQDGHYDRGLLSVLLLNLLHLRPGDAIFLPAGELHSYLAGAGLELMANSNNVLRGGLTDKHIDVDALLSVLHLDPHAPEILRPATLQGDRRWQVYAPPAAEFALYRLHLEAGGSAELAPTAVALGLVLDGDTVITGGDAHLAARQGESFLSPAAVGALRLASTAGADVAIATVPTAP
ncbi:MAG: mannose-6-phosphate isomerase, class I [Thiohalocapsa sp.]